MMTCASCRLSNNLSHFLIDEFFLIRYLAEFKSDSLKIRENYYCALNVDEILAIQVVRPPPDATTYTDYLRAHDITIHRQPVAVSNIIHTLRL